MDRRTFLGRAALAGAAAGLGPLGGPDGARGQGPGPLRVRIWCEGTAPRTVYPEDIDGALAEPLGRLPEAAVARARLDDPHHGLADADLDATDVLVWWGRLRHDDVSAERAEAIAARVRAGRLGFVALHASFASRPFRALMGAPCEPGAWRDDGRPEHVAVADPAHPIARGIAPFVIPRAGMFAEPFAVPTPEAVIFVSSWERDETFRSGLAWTVDAGRVAYFRPGDDAFPVLFHPSVRRVIANAALWAARRA